MLIRLVAGIAKLVVIVYVSYCCYWALVTILVVGVGIGATTTTSTPCRRSMTTRRWWLGCVRMMPLPLSAPTDKVTIILTTTCAVLLYVFFQAAIKVRRAKALLSTSSPLSSSSSHHDVTTIITTMVLVQTPHLNIGVVLHSTPCPYC